MKRKCENCGQTVEFRKGEWPTGWVRSGTSLYGKEFDRAGIAWRCPICHAVESLAIKYRLTSEHQARIRDAMFQALAHRVAA